MGEQAFSPFPRNAFKGVKRLGEYDKGLYELHLLLL